MQLTMRLFKYNDLVKDDENDVGMMELEGASARDVELAPELQYFSMLPPKQRPYFYLVKDWALSKKRIPFSDEIEEYCFLFSDGKYIAMGGRTWGEFAQAIAGKGEGYMEYYSYRGGRESRPINF